MQTFEQAFFINKQVNWQSLMAFGFQIQQQGYQYRENFMNNQFQAIIHIDKTGALTGKVWDLDMQTEYINFRLPQQVGEFVAKVRQDYAKILQKIAEQCFVPHIKYSRQAQRIMAQLPNPDFPFKQYPHYAAYRSAINQKWYALLLPITYAQLDFTRHKPKDLSQEVDILNVKVKPDLLPDCLLQAGIYPSYHMNKRHWISISLDEQMSDKEILQWLNTSRALVERKH